MKGGPWTYMTQGCLGPQNSQAFDGPMILRVDHLPKDRDEELTNLLNHHL